MDDRTRWTQQVTEALDIAPGTLAQVSDPVLDLVRDIAHQVNRPSAPLTAFLVGLAAGVRLPATDDVAATAHEVRAQVARVRELVAAWEPAPGPGPGSEPAGGTPA